jgi:hypothetical protein
VMYTDYTTMLVHECLQETEDGQCEPGQEAIVAYSRTPSPLSPGEIDVLRPIAHQACTSEADFERVPHDGEYWLG